MSSSCLPKQAAKMVVVRLLLEACISPIQALRETLRPAATAQAAATSARARTAHATSRYSQLPRESQYSKYCTNSFGKPSNQEHQAAAGFKGRMCYMTGSCCRAFAQVLVRCCRFSFSDALFTLLPWKTAAARAGEPSNGRLSASQKLVSMIYACIHNSFLIVPHDEEPRTA